MYPQALVLATHCNNCSCNAAAQTIKPANQQQLYHHHHYATHWQPPKSILYHLMNVFGNREHREIPNTNNNNNGSIITIIIIIIVIIIITSGVKSVSEFAFLAKNKIEKNKIENYLLQAQSYFSCFSLLQRHKLSLIFIYCLCKPL